MSTPSVVITPELFARALREEAAHGVLRAWQGGRLAPMVNRSLLKCYLRVLKGLGLVEDRLLRAWVWTWTQNENVRWHEDASASARGEGSGWEICQGLARDQGVPILGSDRTGQEDHLRAESIGWVPLSRFEEWMSGQSGEKT